MNFRREEQPQTLLSLMVGHGAPEVMAGQISGRLQPRHGRFKWAGGGDVCERPNGTDGRRDRVHFQSL